jgi:HEAT repeat protein
MRGDAARVFCRRAAEPEVLRVVTGDNPLSDNSFSFGQTDEPVSTKALEKLSNLNKDQARALGQAWQTIEVERRRSIVETMLTLAEDNVELNYDAIYKMALDDPDGQIRLYAIEGLWENYEPAIADRLIQMMKTDRDPGVRAAAASSLSRFTLNAELGKLKGDLPQRLEVELRGVISNPDESPAVRRRAVETLSYLSVPGIADIVRAAYRDDDVLMRASALQAMGRTCDPAWLDTLLSELTSDEPELRYEAARACGGLGDRRAVPGLIDLLDDDDREVRFAAIASLGEIGGKESRDAIAKRLTSDDQEMSDAAQDALADMEFGEDPLRF